MTRNINYAVKWNAHLKSYHDLLKYKDSLSSSPSASAPLSANNTNILKNIQNQITKEGKVLHAGKTVAPQLPPFSTDYDFSLLSKDQKLQLMTQLLLNYKSTFATFQAALEWACVTGPAQVADVIIEYYPDLVAVGDIIWDTREEEVKEEFRKLGLETNFAALEYLRMSSNKLPPLSFGSYILPSELSIFFSSLFFLSSQSLFSFLSSPSPPSPSLSLALLRKGSNKLPPLPSSPPPFFF